jgi:hypothetical protein
MKKVNLKFVLLITLSGLFSGLYFSQYLGEAKSSTEFVARVDSGDGDGRGDDNGNRGGGPSDTGNPSCGSCGKN